ncbi:MAG: multiheme c-type cytochrome [Planctomycetaceae bacterium]
MNDMSAIPASLRSAMKRLSIAVVIGTLAAAYLATSRPAVSQDSGGVAEPPAVPPAINDGRSHAGPIQNRSNFMGAKACIECHRSEYVAWMGTVHFDGGGINRLDTSKKNSVGAKYKAAHGNLQVCLDCHVPPREVNHGQLQLVSGTSCESCHGAAGGEHGWLNRHSVYGPNVTRMFEESPQHLADRQAFCDNAGMIRSGRVYEIAKNCYSCHIMGNEQLVAEDVGHRIGNNLFDLIPWIQGEVRHNFHMDQHNNADMPTIVQTRTGQSKIERHRVMIVAAQMAIIEVCLRNLAAVSDEEKLEEGYADGWKDRIDEAKDVVEEISEILEEPAEDSGIAPLEDSDLRAVVEAVDALGRRFRDLTRENAASTADAVASHANSFVSRHNGSLLKALDKDFLADPPEPKGRALEP